jgi:hypothetical protein
MMRRATYVLCLGLAICLGVIGVHEGSTHVSAQRREREDTLELNQLLSAGIGADAPQWRRERFEELLQRVRRNQIDARYTKPWPWYVGSAFVVHWVGIVIMQRRRQPNQALQTTSVTPSGFGKVPVSGRQRRGV